MGLERLDLARIGLATVVTAGLALGLAVALLRHAQSTQDVGPTSATLEEAGSLLTGAALGLALGGAFAALAVRRGPPVISGLIVGLLAYVVVVVPVLVVTDDVSVAEDLSLDGLLFLAFLAVPLGACVLVGALVGKGIARLLRRGTN